MNECDKGITYFRPKKFYGLKMFFDCVLRLRLTSVHARYTVPGCGGVFGVAEEEEQKPPLGLCRRILAGVLS